MTYKPNRILVKENISLEYTVRLARDITEADDFEDEFAVLLGASPYDYVKFLVSSSGGSLNTCNLLTKAIRETAAHTIGYIGAECSSAATAIILSCEEWEIDNMSSFMIHTASLGVYGKAPEIEAEWSHRKRQVERFVKNTYTGFLTEAEIQEVIGGKDMWFDGDDLAQRLSNYSTYRDAVREAEQLDLANEEQ